MSGLTVTVGGFVSVQPTRLALATALAVVALMGAACSAGQPAATTAPTGTAGASATAGAAAPSTGTGGTSTPSGASGLSADQAAQAHQAALGLVALGGLGGEKGTTDALRTLAGRVTSEGRALDEQIRTLATAQGLTLSDDVGAQIQGVLNDLQARSGQPFDQAWLRAVGDLVEQGRAAANAVLSSPDASDEAKAAARDALARLDALAAALRDAAGAAAPARRRGERRHGRPGRGGPGAARSAGRPRCPADHSRVAPAPPEGVDPAGGNAAKRRWVHSTHRTPLSLHPLRFVGGRATAMWTAAGAGAACIASGVLLAVVPGGSAEVGVVPASAAIPVAEAAVDGPERRRVRACGGRHGPRRRRTAGPTRQRARRPHRHRPDGALVVPDPPTTVGWWSPGALAGAASGRRCSPGTSTPPQPGSGYVRGAPRRRRRRAGASCAAPTGACSPTRSSAAGSRQGRAARRPVRPRRPAPPRAGHLRRPVRPGDPALHRQRRRLRGPA